MYPSFDLAQLLDLLVLRSIEPLDVGVHLVEPNHLGARRRSFSFASQSFTSSETASSELVARVADTDTSPVIASAGNATIKNRDQVPGGVRATIQGVINKENDAAPKHASTQPP